MLFPLDPYLHYSKNQVAWQGEGGGDIEIFQNLVKNEGFLSPNTQTLAGGPTGLRGRDVIIGRKDYRTSMGRPGIRCYRTPEGMVR